MPIPENYETAVYAGVLGKIIGVYLGRPFEGWPHRRILKELGEIEFYVNDKLNRPLIVADDDISGTFTFIRALEDHGISREITPDQIGQTWLNYLIEERTILWWGGMGTSTEHTAYLRLKHGIPAPESGSIATNTKVVAEQIGAQIFIDSWAMICPGEPELAAEFALKAGSVSHDGEAIYGAQALAAMEAAAFFEKDIQTLLEIALRQIPYESIIAALIADIRNWHGQDSDWKQTFLRIEEKYGYEKYGGGCHMIPNHAVIILALLYGEGDFQKSLMIANTAGWDTDCNSGNVGCLLGIRNGLEGIDHGPDWRGPVADRMYKISADGGDAVTDTVRETYRICRLGRSLLGETQLPAPKGGARFSFSLPGSLQGFTPHPDYSENVALSNVDLTLSIQLSQIAPDAAVFVRTPTHASSDEMNTPGYRMIMSPTLYSGQTVSTQVHLDAATDGPVQIALAVETFSEDSDSSPQVHRSEPTQLDPGSNHTLKWRVPDTNGLPVTTVGFICAAQRPTSGSIKVDSLDWSGVPSCTFTGLGWTDGIDRVRNPGGHRFELIHDEGRGIYITGTQDWTHYRFSARVATHMASESGIALRVRGMKRFYALLLCSGQTVRLLKAYDQDKVLAQSTFAWEPDRKYQLSLTAKGSNLIAEIDGDTIFDITDSDLPTGAIALIDTEGRTAFSEVRIDPLDP
jgi:ADP-ribosylglycohydrolase